MPARDLICEIPTSTPSGQRTGSTRGLPEDLLREASRRLAIMALLGGVLWIIGSILMHVAFRLMYDDPEWLKFQSPDVITLVSATVSFGLYHYVRRSTRSPQFILDLGQGFLIFTAIALGLIWHIKAGPAGWQVAPVMSWIGVVVMMFAAIIPSTPARTLVTGLIAVSMGPAGMVLAKLTGNWNYGSEINLFVMHYPDYLLVAIAVVISHVVTRLGHQVTRAREMGSYQLGDLLGKGGMGEVYRATHRMLARPAAIKLIRAESFAGRESPERDLAVKRFRREAEVAASLRSPHTVELYDFGVTDDQTLYFVMELLEGMTLEALVREHGPVPPGRVVHILRQVCDSLAEAHARGLVHRDIKPANLHIGPRGLQHDVVKVLDFGLVKSVRANKGESSLATGLGATPGTPDYMAPEMTLGDQVDARADIYALGCVAYFLLTAKLVFEGSSVFHTIARHLNDQPVPPTARAGIAIPSALESLVLTCLAKRPADRPQTAAELDRALARMAVEPWSDEQAAEWWQLRHAVPA